METKRFEEPLKLFVKKFAGKNEKQSSHWLLYLKFGSVSLDGCLVLLLIFQHMYINIYIQIYQEMLYLIPRKKIARRPRNGFSVLC